MYVDSYNVQEYLCVLVFKWTRLGMQSVFLRWTRRPLRPYCIDVPDDLRDNLIVESLSGHDKNEEEEEEEEEEEGGGGVVAAGSSASSPSCGNLTCPSPAGRPERAEQWHLHLSEKDASSLIKYKVGGEYGDSTTVTIAFF